VCSLYGPLKLFLIAEDGVRSQISPYEIYGGQSGTGSVFHRVLRFCPVNIIPPLLHTHLHLDVAFTRKATCSLHDSLQQRNVNTKIHFF
jgi:hypothetical protein